MNSLYNQALRQFSSIQSDLSRLDADPHSTPVQFGPVTASLTALTRTIDEYESLAKRELIQSKQEKALARVAKFRNDYKELNTQLARLKQRGSNGDGGPQSPSRGTVQAYSTASSYRSSGTAESPYSLHSRGASTYATSPYASSSHLGANGTSPSSSSAAADPLSAYKMNASAAAMFGAPGAGGYSAREGHALREHTFIEQTEAQLDAFIAQGREVFGNLVEQRSILKGTQRKLLDAANTLGLSRDVIGYIERRSTQDNIIFAVGAIFTLVCFYYIYKWFG
ncbi:Protein transport protein bos1 [Thecaphora frezii]